MTTAVPALDERPDTSSRERGVLDSVQHTLHGHPALSPAFVLVLASLIFGFINQRFFLQSNLATIFQQVAVVGTLAVGQTLIILTAGIDLSVGAVMLFSQMVMAKMVQDQGVPGYLALLIGIGLSALAGVLNGVLVTKVKLPPFIVTLGTLSVFTSVGLLYASGQSVEHPGALLLWPGTRIALGQGYATFGVLLMLALYAVVGYALRGTAWGRHVYATGDDPEAARLAGIKTERVLISVYVVGGVVFGIAAWILIGRMGTASPNAAVDVNLDSITAVVIGGTSLFGGRGSLLGTLLGALIVGVFRNGLFLAGVDQYYQNLAVGVLIIAAVAVDQWIRKVGA
jgi:fructose transport system permease protein